MAADPVLPAPLPLSEFNAQSADDAAAAIRPCCASDRWISAVVDGRPYESLAALTATSASALGELHWADIEQALAAHPRIGDRAQGSDQESAWSRQEQSATADADTGVQEQLRAGNIEYQERFGNVFLIRAAGRSTSDMLAALTERLGHDPSTERLVVREQLAQIVDLRLAKAFADQ